MAGMTYKRKMWSLAGLALVSTIVVGLILGVLGRDVASDTNFWIIFPAMLLICAAMAWVVWLWWKPLDDLQKHAHMWSWYFGGMAGAVILMTWLIASKAQHSDFGWGAAVMFFAQTAGFFAFYLFWWLRGRGRGE